MAASPFRPALDLMAQYAAYHRDKRNIVTHFIGIREQGDAGTPIVASAPESAVAVAYRATARRMAAELARRPKARVSLGAQLL